MTDGETKAVLACAMGQLRYLRNRMAAAEHRSIEVADEQLTPYSDPVLERAMHTASRMGHLLGECYIARDILDHALANLEAVIDAETCIRCGLPVDVGDATATVSDMGVAHAVCPGDA